MTTAAAIFGTDHRWTFYAVSVVTGQMITELPLVDASIQVRLESAGSFSAKLPLGQYALLSDAQQLIDATTPGKYSVVLDLDGVIIGEWVIWKRARNVESDVIDLSGSEVISMLDHRIMWSWSWANTEQFVIATALAREGFIGNPSGITAQVSFPAYVPSGQLRDRSYVALDGTIGTRLRELSQVDGGFDYWLTTAWDPVSALLAVKRDFTLAYPRAGVDQLFTFELGANLAAAQLDEDAVNLASRAFALGQTTNDVLLYGQKQDLTLVNDGFPLMDRSGSWTSVTDQATIDHYAQSLLADSQNISMPLNAKIFLDQDPVFGEYHLGDRVELTSPPSAVFPGGVRRLVRIVGWDIQPDVGTPTTVSLVVTAEG